MYKMRRMTTAIIMASCMTGVVSTPNAIAEDKNSDSIIFVPFTDSERGTPDDGFDKTQQAVVWEGTDGAPIEAQPEELLPAPELHPTANGLMNISNPNSVGVRSVEGISEETPLSGDINTAHMGGDETLPEDVDWDAQLKNLEEKLNGAKDHVDQLNNFTREEQIAADILFRRQNQAYQNQNTNVIVDDGILYPPETVGGQPTVGDPSAVTPVVKPKQEHSVPLPPNATQADKVVAAAMSVIGTPYVWGGTIPGVGLDCSGLTQWAYSQIGVNIPRVTYDQINIGTPIHNQNDIQPGDLVFPNSGHVGIAISNTEMIHAPQPGESVKIGPIYAFQQGVRVL